MKHPWPRGIPLTLLACMGPVAPGPGTPAPPPDTGSPTPAPGPTPEPGGSDARPADPPAAPLACPNARRSEGTAPPVGAATWTPVLKWPTPIRGNGLVVDPAVPGDFYAFYQSKSDSSGDGHVLRSTDFGLTWKQVDQMTVRGNAWGVAIDPNPRRCAGGGACPPPTMYRPAGYGFGNPDGSSLGVWKSVDGGATWRNLFKGYDRGMLPRAGGGTVLVPPDKNGIHTDFYQVHILPDDPPNHILITYHYGHVLLESADGGETWEVHDLPWGSSHYVYGVDGKTWIVLAQQFDAPGGTYRTTTAGRSNGTISADAWTKVDSMLHCHGAFTPWVDPTDCSLYFAGSEGVKRSTDGGATWASVMSGSGGLCTVIGSSNFIYASALFRKGGSRGDLRTNPIKWEAVSFDWGDGVAPYAAASSFDARRGEWVMLQFSYGGGGVNGDIWRRADPQ